MWVLETFRIFRIWSCTDKFVRAILKVQPLLEGEVWLSRLTLPQQWDQTWSKFECFWTSLTTRSHSQSKAKESSAKHGVWKMQACKSIFQAHLFQLLTLMYAVVRTGYKMLCCNISQDTVKSCIKAAAYVQFFNFLVRLLFKCGFYLRVACMQRPESAKLVKSVWYM